ncbi:unnamed protein product [Closterium sp. Naga37s-1]|nr:unnamed protein product [Closterium sp. Naga37s-1]
MMAAADGDYLRFLIENKLLFYPPYVQHDKSSCRGGLRVPRQQHIGLSGTAAVGASSLPLRNEHAAAARGVDIAAASSGSARGSSHGHTDSMNAERLRAAMISGAASSGGIAPDSSSAFTWPLPVTAQRRWAEEPRKRPRESEPAVQPWHKGYRVPCMPMELEPAVQPELHKSYGVTCMPMEAPGHSGAPQRNSFIPELPQRASHVSQLPERAPLVSETPQRASIHTITYNSRPHSHSTGLLPRPRRCWTQQGEAQAQLSRESAAALLDVLDGSRLHSNSTGLLPTPWRCWTQQGEAQPEAQLSRGSAAALLNLQRACALRRWERSWVSHRPPAAAALAEVGATRSAATQCAGGDASPQGQDLLAEVAAAAAAQSWDGRLLAELGTTRSAGGASPQGHDLLAEVAAAAAAQSWDGGLLAETMGVRDGAGERSRGRSIGRGGSGGRGGCRGSEGRAARAGSWPICFKNNGECVAGEGRNLRTASVWHDEIGSRDWQEQQQQQLQQQLLQRQQRQQQEEDMQAHAAEGISPQQSPLTLQQAFKEGIERLLHSVTLPPPPSRPAANVLPVSLLLEALGPHTASAAAAAGLSSQSAAAATPDPCNSPPARPATVTYLERNPGSARSPAGGSVDLSLRLGLSLEREETEREEKGAAGGNDEGSAGGAAEQRGEPLVSMPGHQWYAPYGGCTSCVVGSDKSQLSSQLPQSMQSMQSSQPTLPPQSPQSQSSQLTQPLQWPQSAFAASRDPMFRSKSAATATAAAPDADPVAGASMGVHEGYALARDNIWECETAGAGAAGGPEGDISRGRTISCCESKGGNVCEANALLYERPGLLCWIAI